LWFLLILWFGIDSKDIGTFLVALIFFALPPAIPLIYFERKRNKPVQTMVTKDATRTTEEKDIMIEQKLDEKCPYCSGDLFEIERKGLFGIKKEIRCKSCDNKWKNIDQLLKFKNMLDELAKARAEEKKKIEVDKFTIKFCPKCGNEISKRSNFCQNCGQDLTTYKAKSSGNTFGVAALASAIVGFITSFVGLGILFGPLAIILGAIAQSRGEKYAIAGIFLGIITTLWSLFIEILAALIFF